MKNNGRINNALRTVNSISRIIFIVAGAGSLAAMVVLILLDVSLRTFINRPVMSSYELVMFLMSIAVFSSFGYAQSEKKIVKIEVFVSILPKKVQLFLEVLTMFLSLIIITLLTFRNIVRCVEIRQEHIISPILQIPVYPFYGMVAFGYLMLSLVIFTNILESLKNMSGK